MWITTNCGKFLKRCEYQTTLPASWETCMQVRKQHCELDMEKWTGSKLRKESVKAGCILSPCLFNLYTECVLECACSVSSVVFNSLLPYGLQLTRLLCPWDSAGRNTGVGCHAFLQGIFRIPGIKLTFACVSFIAGRFFTHWATWEALNKQLLLLLSRFSRVWLCATP